jgi:calmodulin
MQTYGGADSSPTAGAKSVRPQPKFLQSPPMTERSDIGKYMLGDLPNLHEQLFWADRKGPHYLENYVRICLLYLAVYIPMLSKNCYNMYNDPHYVKAHLIVKVVLGLLPWVLSFVVLTKISALLEVCNVETMKHKPMIDKVKSDQLAAKVIKLFKVLNNLRTYSQVNNDSQMVVNGDVDFTHMDPEWKADIEQIFKTYDVDNSGTLEPEELLRFLHSLGQNASPEKAQALCAALDKDGNGQISCEEFVSWMYVQHLNQNSADQPKETLADVAHGMFSLFDEDSSGEIQRTEMNEALKRFGVSMTDDELNLLMCELDPNGDGKISFNEFHELLERHNFSV